MVTAHSAASRNVVISSMEYCPGTIINVSALRRFINPDGRGRRGGRTKNSLHLEMLAHLHIYLCRESFQACRQHRKHHTRSRLDFPSDNGRRTLGFSLVLTKSRTSIRIEPSSICTYASEELLILLKSKHPISPAHFNLQAGSIHGKMNAL